MSGDRRSTRLAVVGTIAAVLFSALGLRMWFLQVVDAPVLEQKVEANKTRTVRLLPERGRIFDRDGRIMADNERILTITVAWDVMKREADRLELFARLSPVLDVSVTDLENRYDSGRYSPLLPMPVKEGVGEDVALYLIERSEDFPGVDVANQWRRDYPYAPLAAHVVGYMGAITPDDAEQYRDLGYDLNERVGQFGVEKIFEPYLRGTPGFVRYEVDSRGAIL
ncbi:MAG: penicillin-binding protein 2, partial [Actinomycetota bacterium]